MADLKTKPTRASVTAFVDDIDAKVLEKLVSESVKIISKRYT